MPTIKCENVVFDYPGRRALSDICFELPDNSVTALVGPNGAGKTTLMRCLAGLDAPITGRITIGDIKLLEDPRAGFQKTGYLHDSFGLYPTLTVLQCLRHAAAMRGASGKTEKEWVDRAIARLGLQGRLKDKAGNLSRGWRQRVGVAQAIIHDPSFLILDEPASGLDPDARIHLSGLITDLRKEGMTIIVSSHILSELEAYSSHMLTMAEGRIVNFSATTHEVAPTEQRVQVTIENGWANWADIAGLRLLDQKGATAEILLVGDTGAHATVLRQLIESGAAVSAFHPLRESMESRYMRIIDAAGKGAAK